MLSTLSKKHLKKPTWTARKPPHRTSETIWLLQIYEFILRIKNSLDVHLLLELKVVLKQKENKLHKLILGRIDENDNAKLQEFLSIKLQGYNRVIDNYAIRHTLKKHGTEKETLRGQVQILPEDFQEIHDIISNPDSIKDGGKNKMQNHVVIYARNLNRGNYIYVEEIRTGKKLAVMQTMFIKKPLTPEE